jgi:hypothetical protein
MVPLRAELACECAPVRRLVADTARRLRGVRRLPAGSGGRRYVAILQLAGRVDAGRRHARRQQSGRTLPGPHPKVIHARHH